MAKTYKTNHPQPFSRQDIRESTTLENTVSWTTTTLGATPGNVREFPQTVHPHPDRKTRTSILWIVCALAVLWQASCVRETPTPGTEMDRLVVVLDKSIPTLDPRFTNDATSMKVSRLVFSALISVDNATLEPKYDLATDIFPDPDDPLRWHVRIRENVLFHDGSPLTGTDVAYTFQSVLDSALGSPFHGDYQTKFHSVEEHPDDPMLVTFVLHKPYATFLTDLVLGIVRKPDAKTDQTGSPSRTIVGTGPFRFVERSGDRRLTLERFNDWYGTLPGYRWLVFRIIPDESTRLLSILGGSSDLLLNGISPILLDVIEDQPEIYVKTAPAIAFTYLGFNLRDSRLSDMRVRRALALGIDRQSIITYRFKGKARRARSMLPEFHWAYNPQTPLLPYDPNQAKILLDAAGYTPDPSTGIRLELELKVSADRFRRSIARMLARQWGEIGVQLKIRSFEFSTFFADVRSGNFDLFMLQLPEPIEPDMHRWMFYSLSTPETGPFKGPSPYALFDRRGTHPNIRSLIEDPLCGPWAHEAIAAGEERIARGKRHDLGSANRTYYANPRIDCLVDLGQQEQDQEKRKALYGEVQTILAKELPIVPLWHEDNIVVLRKKARAFTLLPNARLGTLTDVQLEY